MMKVKGNKLNRYSMLLWIVNISFIIFFLMWVSINWKSNQVFYDYNARLFPWVCGLICVQMFSFRIKKVSFYDFGLWFVVISYLFMFGYLFQDVFELKSELLWNPIVKFDNSTLFHSYIFVIMCLEFFSIGYLMAYRGRSMLKKYKLKMSVPNKKMYNIGIVLSLFGGMAKLINDLQIVFFMQSIKTYSAYSQAVSSGIWDDLSYLMLPGIFFIFFSGFIKERTKKIIFITTLIYLFSIMILTGSRKIQIFSMLSLFLGYEFSLQKRHLSIWRIMLYAFLAIITLNVVITIRDYRFDMASIVPVLMEKVFLFNLFGNIFGETFAETGITLLSVTSIVKLVPSIMPYQYGVTYLRTIPSFLPIGWFVGDFFNLASSTYVINTYTGIPAGSSFIGDLYWNWGYFGGVIMSFLSGVLICKFLQIKSKSNIRKSYAMYFSIFSQLIVLVRSELVDVYRPIIMIIFAVFILEQFNRDIRKVRK